MKTFRGYSRTMIAALTLIVISALIIFAVYAQSSNTIQGCYSDGNGSLRRVNSPSDCYNSETAISWSITGPQGPQGIPGPPGPQGPPGPGVGITGRWVGTLTGSESPSCGYPGAHDLDIIFIQLSTGDLTGAVRILPDGTATSILGTVNGSTITFDTFNYLLTTLAVGAF